jgi:hypothetical protein
MAKLKQSSSHRNLTCRVGGALLLFTMLAVAACAGGGTTGGSGNSPTATAPGPTATAPGPTATISLQQITVAYCSKILPLATANQIIPSSTPATSITQGNPNNALSGACNYKVSSSQFLLVIFFIPYHGPDPIPQSDIQSVLSQAAGTKLTITTLNMVSGIGDQAAYVEVTGSANGISATVHIFYVLEGSFIFDCFTESYLSPVMANQSQLQQCATTVDTNLRA